MDLTTFGMAGVAAITRSNKRRLPINGCPPSAARWAVCWGCWPGAEVCRTSRQATH